MENKTYLISKNEHLAQAKSIEFENKQFAYNTLLAYYNNLPVLNALDTKDEVFKFLSSPVEYFNNALVNETGIQISPKVQLKPEVIAQMASIPYEETIRFFQKTRINQLDWFDWSKQKGVFLKEGAIDILYEAAEEWTEEGPESEAYRRALELCDIVNKWIDDMQISYANHHKLAKELRLQAKGKVGGYILEPDIYQIRQRLQTGKLDAFLI